LVASGQKEELTLPESDVLYYELQDGYWFAIRPSGTEPKIKIYYGVKENTMDKAKEKLKLLQDNVLSVIEKLLFD
jgi:phosphoglucomutase